MVSIWVKILFRPECPKCDQNLQFTSLSETKSMFARFMEGLSGVMTFVLSNELFMKIGLCKGNSNAGDLWARFASCDLDV